MPTGGPPLVYISSFIKFRWNKVPFIDTFLGYVNIFLFIVYFTYIIIGGVVFMWLEKPEEERVCRSDFCRKIHFSIFTALKTSGTKILRGCRI